MWHLQVFLPTGKVWDKEFDSLLHMLCFSRVMQSVGFRTKSGCIEFPSLWKPL